MPTIPSAREIQEQFSQTVEEFRTICRIHEFPTGRWEDLRDLPQRISRDGAFRADIAEIVRSLQHQNGTTLGLPEVLDILIIAIGSTDAFNHIRSLEEPLDILGSFLASIGGWPGSSYEPVLEPGEIPSSMPPSRPSPPSEIPGSTSEARLPPSTPPPTPPQVAPIPAPPAAEILNPGSYGEAPAADNLDARSLLEIAEALSRLERGTFELRSHLDSIDQRISRMEPLLETSTPPDASPAFLADAPPQAPQRQAAPAAQTDAREPQRRAQVPSANPAQPVPTTPPQAPAVPRFSRFSVDEPAAAPAPSFSSPGPASPTRSNGQTAPAPATSPAANWPAPPSATTEQTRPQTRPESQAQTRSQTQATTPADFRPSETPAPRPAERMPAALITESLVTRSSDHEVAAPSRPSPAALPTRETPEPRLQTRGSVRPPTAPSAADLSPAARAPEPPARPVPPAPASQRSPEAEVQQPSIASPRPAPSWLPEGAKVIATTPISVRSETLFSSENTQPSATETVRTPQEPRTPAPAPQRPAPAASSAPEPASADRKPLTPASDRPFSIRPDPDPAPTSRPIPPAPASDRPRAPWPSVTSANTPVSGSRSSEPILSTSDSARPTPQAPARRPDVPPAPAVEAPLITRATPPPDSRPLLRPVSDGPSFGSTSVPFTQRTAFDNASSLADNPHERSGRRLMIAILVLAILALAAAAFFYFRNSAEPRPATSAAPIIDGSNAAQSASTSPATTPAEAATAPNTSSTPRVLGARESFHPAASGEDTSPPAASRSSAIFVPGNTMGGQLLAAPITDRPPLNGAYGSRAVVPVEVLISASGEVESVRPLGGNHLLREAAINSVHNWRYRPFLRNGQPVPVRTIVRVDFNQHNPQPAARSEPFPR